MSDRRVPTMGELDGRIALVTGATRGIGKGIAIELAAAGATTYFTGRTVRDDPAAELPGSLDATGAEIVALGGVGRPVRCNHADDDDVRALVERIRDEEGRLDVLVNNVYSSPDLAPWLGRPFWELPIRAWDQVIDIGVRSHYVASALAAPIMLGSGRGLIVNVSGPGATQYMHNVVYGVGKAALDRITADCAFELEPHGVSVVSLWPGIVRTEFTGSRAPRDAQGRQFLMIAGEGTVDLTEAETPRFSGRAVVALAADPDVRRRTGQVVRTGDLAAEYGFTDVDGRIPRVRRRPQTPAGSDAGGATTGRLGDEG